MRAKILVILSLLVAAVSWGGIALVAPVTGRGIAAAATPEPALCTAYAQAAFATVSKAVAEGLETPGPGRWDPSYDNHYNACMSWGDAAGVNAMNETLGRANDLAVLEARAKGQPMPYSADHQFANQAATLDSFCRGYAFLATQQVAAQESIAVSARQQGKNVCAFDNTQGRWDTDFEHHRTACMEGFGANIGTTVANESNGRTQDLIACQVALATPPATPVATPPTNTQPPPPVQTAGTVTVLLDSDVYNGPGNGQQNGVVLAAGTAGVTLQQPCADSWCQLKWPAGQGYVYSGPGYVALKLN